MRRTSHATADEALRAWADYRIHGYVVDASLYDADDRRTDDRAPDDPELSWRVLCVSLALYRSRSMDAVARALYLRELPQGASRMTMRRRRPQLLEYIATCLTRDPRYTPPTIADAAIAEAKRRKRSKR